MTAEAFSSTELLNVLLRTSRDPGDLTGSLQHIARVAQQFFAADACAIFAINPITQRFIESLTVTKTSLRRNLVFDTQPGPGGLTRQVLKQSIVIIPDLEAAPEYHSRFTRAENIHSFAGLALYAPDSGKPLGVLYINFGPQRNFSASDRHLLLMFANLAAFILQETWLLWRYQKVATIRQG